MHYTMAIDEDAYLWGCGQNSDHQLGIVHETNRLEKICKLKFRSVSCGGFHTVAIDENGYLWGCGTHSV